MAIFPQAVSFTAVTSVVGQATGISTTGFLDSPDYTTELAALQAQIETMDLTLKAMNLTISAINANLLLINQYLLAVQTESGDFRTFDLSSVSNNTLVTTALTKSAIPVPPNPGV